MNAARKLSVLLLLPAIIMSGGCSDKKQSRASMAERIARKSLVDDYPRIPRDEILRETKNNSLYSELKNRYAQSLSALKTEVEHDKAKLIVVVMTPEIGKFTTPANTNGIPYITETCTNLGIECVDFTPDLAEWMEADPQRAPVESSFTKEGAAFMAGLLSSIIEKYDGYSSPTVYPREKPETFGDLNTKEDEVLDGEKNIPYRLTVNAQGLRMNHNLTFPKKKQTILFLGDSRIFNPYLDNEYIITELLQQKYPGKEIVNAGNLQYTIDDYYTLYVEKARYTEPDVVIVCTNGGDILDNYFSQRNKYARSGKSYKPTELEKKFYQQLSR